MLLLDVSSDVLSSCVTFGCLSVLLLDVSSDVLSSCVTLRCLI